MAKVYGIDLGTTYSCIASYDGDKMEIIYPRNAVMGGVNLPSVIQYEKETGTPIVGLTAKRSLGVSGEASRIMECTKRHMGEEFYPNKIRVKNDEISISPIEGSACILHHLLSCANEESRGKGEEVTNKAVITIPAGFTNKQRECTKLAAELAGIEVLGLVHEPTAAAISYNIKSGETILVFDLGGGTLDVSIVTNNKGNYKVIAAAGDFDILGRNLGGKDWDDRLLQFAMEKHEYKLGNIPNLQEETERGLLKNTTEECKINLSGMQESFLSFPNLTSEKIKRKEFEDCTDDLVVECLKVVKAALDKADKVSDNGSVKIDRCVLSGGSSNMPIIKNSLSRFLAERVANNRSEKEWLSMSKPEVAIAEGAAKYAYMLTSGQAKNDNILVGVEEKSSHSYGTVVYERKTGVKFIRNLIRSTDPMIVDSHSFSFGVNQNGQSIVAVDLYENNSTEERIPYSGDLKKIYDGVYSFNSKTEVKQGETKVNFTVSRDKDGIISIHVESQGHNPDDYKISTVIPLISEASKRHVIQSIQLMDTVSEDCK